MSNTDKKETFITQSTKTIINQLETDIQDTENGLDSTYQFSPLCWLESCFTNYAADISSYTFLEPIVPYATMLEILRDKVQSLTSQQKPISPTEAKFVMVLCQLILLVPVRKTTPDVNICLTDLLKMRFGKFSDLGEFKDLVFEWMDKVIIISVIAGSNPIPGLLLVQQSNNNVIGLVRSLKVGNHNISTYRCILGAIVPYMQQLPQQQRPEFCQAFYDLLGTFNAEHPSQHHEMLKLSVNQAQLVIDAILNWGKNIEPEQFPILCTLLPLCTVALQDLATNKKSQYHAIFKSLGDYKFKKGQDVEGPAFAYLELYCALAHTVNFPNKDVYKLLTIGNHFLFKTTLLSEIINGEEPFLALPTIRKICAPLGTGCPFFKLIPAKPA